jgi:hypothetical protein
VRRPTVQGFLGCVGGALGALPLVPAARSIATRFAPVPRLPGVERAVGDLKAATWAEVAALLVALPAAALFFGLVLPRFLEVRTGRWSEWPGVAFGSAFPLFRSGVPARYSLAVALMLSAFAAATVMFQADPAGRLAALPGERTTAMRALIFGTLLLLFGCGLWIYAQPGNNVDLFEDGHVLGPAQAYLSGGRPYVDTYPIHGWGADGGADAFFFRIFSPTLETFRVRRAVWTALALPALAAAALVLFDDGFWAGLSMLLAVSICPFVSERQTLAFAAIAALTAAARRRNPILWLLAGAISAWTLFFTLDFGLMALGGGVGTAGVLGVLDRDWRGARAATLRFLAGAFLGSVPFLALLAAHGALGDFARVSFVDIPGTIVDAWGLPAGTSSVVIVRGSASEAFRLVFHGDEMPALFFVLVLALGVTVLIGRAILRTVQPVDRAAAAVLCVSILALRGVLGRADAGHLSLYGVVVALPAAWLVYRAAHAGRYRIVLTAILLVALFVRLRPDRAIQTEWTALRQAPGARATSASQPHIPRSGRATVSAEQAGELAALQADLDALLAPGQTFFDYSNEPALYFLMNRTPPIRHGIVPFYEPEAKQREVIAALERIKPPLAILSGGSFDAPDAISNRDRTPLVATYLDRAYEPVAKVAGRTLARRRIP